VIDFLKRLFYSLSMRFKSFGKSLEQDSSKRDEILDAAQTVFASVGFKEATVRQICKKAKANVCLVSYYFGGKEGLYHSLFERMYKGFSLNFQKILQVETEVKTVEEFKARLQVYIEQVYSNMQENREFVSLVQRELSENVQNSVAIKFITENKQKLITFITYGQKKKFLKKDLDPHLAAGILMVLISSFVQQQQNPDQLKDLYPDISTKEFSEKILSSILTIYFNGVLQ
jgi:AcrR family transcriptional regulator